LFFGGTRTASLVARYGYGRRHQAPAEPPAYRRWL